MINNLNHTKYPFIYEKKIVELIKDRIDSTMEGVGDDLFP